MALEKTRMGKAHIDFLACGLAGFAPRLVIGLEKMYGIDFRASTDDTGNDVNGGDWKMETDNDYDVADDYLDRVKLVAYTEKMSLFGKSKKGIAAAKNVGKGKVAAGITAVSIGQKLCFPYQVMYRSQGYSLHCWLTAAEMLMQWYYGDGKYSSL